MCSLELFQDMQSISCSQHEMRRQMMRHLLRCSVICTAGIGVSNFRQVADTLEFGMQAQVRISMPPSWPSYAAPDFRAADCAYRWCNLIPARSQES